MSFDFSFDELSVALSFALGAAPSAPAAGKQQQQQQQKQQKQQKEQKAKGGDDDMDLFGDEEEAQEEQPKLSLKERAAALKAKKKQDAKVERSQLVFEVKPVDTEVDLHALYREITKFQKEGLTWGEGYELKPVAYGINKLVMSCVIVDELVGVDDVTEPIEALEDWVQSVDVNTMNKL